MQDVAPPKRRGRTQTLFETAVKSGFDQIFKGDVIIKKLKNKHQYRITFSKVYGDRFFFYQVFNKDNTDNVNDQRFAAYITIKNYINIYNNYNATSKLNNTLVFTPTTIMELPNFSKYAFVINNMYFNSHKRLVFMVSTKEINLQNNISKKLTQIPCGKFKHVRFDIDDLNYSYNNSIMTREDVRDHSLQFFKTNVALQIVPTSGIVNYSPAPSDYNIQTFVTLATVKRNEYMELKYNLPIFTMLYLKTNKTNKHAISVLMSYFKSFCKADMSKLGIVSITDNNELGLPGIEPRISLLNEYGILTKNILIRKDVEVAYENGSGDGYWRSPYAPYHGCSTFSVMYPLKNNSYIANYKNPTEWLEIGECGLPLKSERAGSSFGAGFGLGMERIEYVFFSIPFPSK